MLEDSSFWSKDNLYTVANITVSDIPDTASLWRSQLQHSVPHPKPPTHNSARAAVFLQYTPCACLCMSVCSQNHCTNLAKLVLHTFSQISKWKIQWDYFEGKMQSNEGADLSFSLRVSALLFLILSIYWDIDTWNNKGYLFFYWGIGGLIMDLIVWIGVHLQELLMHKMYLPLQFSFFGLLSHMDIYTLL